VCVLWGEMPRGSREFVVCFLRKPAPEETASRIRLAFSAEGSMHEMPDTAVFKREKGTLLKTAVSGISCIETEVVERRRDT